MIANLCNHCSQCSDAKDTDLTFDQEEENNNNRGLTVWGSPETNLLAGMVNDLI